MRQHLPLSTRPFIVLALLILLPLHSIPHAVAQQNATSTDVLLPIFVAPPAPEIVPIVTRPLDRLLATGQTQGYRGNVGAPADGNRDDGDLINGRLARYEFAATYPPTSQAENVVLDLQTGLMWIRSVELLTGDDANDGATSVADGVDLNKPHTWQEAIEAAQNLTYAGHDDWRLPTIKELQTLVDYGAAEPSINTDAFPLAFDEWVSGYSWTSTTNPAQPEEAFYVNFLNGHTFPFGKETGFWLRPVRTVAIMKTGQTTGYVGDDGAVGDGNGDDGNLQVGLTQVYTVTDDGVIDSAAENLAIDENTNLMWIRDPLLLDGAGTDVGGNVDLRAAVDWQASIDRVNALNYGGYDDWRMPNLVELESIAQPGRAGGIYDPVVFPNAPVDPNNREAIIWWSSTTSVFDEDAQRLGKDSAWFQTSALGSTNFGAFTEIPAKAQAGYVRPVRTRQRNEDPNEPARGEIILSLAEVRTAAEFTSITQPSVRADLLREGKFLLRVDESVAPSIPFVSAYQDVNEHPLHFEFLKAAFPEDFAGIDADEYTALVARRETRQFYAGGIKSFTDASGRVVYGFDVFTDPTDAGELLSETEVAELYGALLRNFRRRPLVYSPSRAAAIGQAQGWTDAAFPIGFPAVAAAPDYEAYTAGQAIGVVRLLTVAELAERAEAGLLSRQDIVVVDGAPVDLESVVAGIVTGDRQPQLAHLNVRMARRGTANGFVAESHAAFAPFADQLVRLSLTRAGYFVETDVTAADASAFWAANRPLTVTIGAPDFAHTGLDPLATIAVDEAAGTHSATLRVGGKAANLARLSTVLPSAYQVPGFGIPFHYYDAFMAQNLVGTEPFADFVIGLHEDAAFRNDPQVRVQKLDDVRDLIRKESVLDATVIEEIAGQVDAVFGEGTMVRFRSSSNAEDGLAFNGAGLYDSTSVCVLDSFDGDEVGPSRCDPNQPKERTIERGLTKVWASLWNFRAWEERDFYGIDHLTASMAILVTPAFPDERANGVAFTGDPTDLSASADKYLINVQDGDVSMVLPESGALPERDRLTVADGGVTAIERLRGSSLLAAGETVMSDAELVELGEVLALVDEAFPVNLGAYTRDDVLLDLEFKIRRGDDQLLFKQVRPFLKQTAETTGRTPVLRLDTPAPISLCGTWREGYSLAQELAEKVVVDLPATDAEFELVAGSAGQDFFGAARLGPPLTTMTGNADGAFTLADPNADGLTQATLSRSYLRGGEEMTLRLDLFNVYANEFGLVRLDEESLTNRLAVTGELGLGPIFGETDVVGSPLRLAPCGYSLLPLVEFDIELANGGRILLYQRSERDDGVTGQAALVEARVTLPQGSATVTDYARLVYTADRHHWNEKFWVLFDAPLDLLNNDGQVAGVQVIQTFAGSVEPTYAVALLGAGQGVIGEVEVLSVVRRVGGE